MKKKLSFLITIFFVLSLCVSCGVKSADNPETAAGVTEAASETENEEAKNTEPETETVKEKEDVIIVFTNDIHSAIYNVYKESDGQVKQRLNLSEVAAFFRDVKAAGKQALLIDCGDEIQGDLYGDKGSKVIELMNMAGYDIGCPGNHDFDYGMDLFFEQVEQSDFPQISCNFRRISDGSLVFPATKIFDMNGTKVAFVGISSARTISSSTPGSFMDEDGNFLYSFDGSEDANELYESVQAAIDLVRDEADYVIALGHVGIGTEDDAKGVSSEQIIGHTKGLDVFVDGHSHSTLEEERLKDLSGNEVVLTQSGEYLSSFGVVTISKTGEISSKLVTDYGRSVPEMKELEDKLHKDVLERMGQKVAELQSTLYIYHPEIENQRLIRAREMNTGDFASDSVYWYFNECMGQNCDAVITNSGGVRSQLTAGDLTYYDLNTICPFGNQLCLIKATGQEILDTLEMGAIRSGSWDSEWNKPSENGFFMQVAGLRYSVDCSVNSSVVMDGDGSFIRVDGEYRVKDVQVYNKESGTYEDLDPDKEYTIGGSDYLYRDNGGGLVMFGDNELIVDFAGEDTHAPSIYASAFTKEGEYPVISSKNSPLAKYVGYDLNYENPYGADRIKLLNASY